MTKSDYVHERITDEWISLYRSHCTHRKTVHCTAFVKLLAELDYHRETLRHINAWSNNDKLGPAAKLDPIKRSLRERHPELGE